MEGASASPTTVAFLYTGNGNKLSVRTYCFHWDLSDNPLAWDAEIIVKNRDGFTEGKIPLRGYGTKAKRTRKEALSEARKVIACAKRLREEATKVPT